MRLRLNRRSSLCKKVRRQKRRSHKQTKITERSFCVEIMA
nr:MAG TPA: hypothetical protein [Caudoviricetes sp.]